MKLPKMTPERRQYVYNVITCLAPCLVALGLVASDDAQVALLLVGAILGVGGTGLAGRNVSAGPRDLEE